jgi:hypothetical protein
MPLLAIRGAAVDAGPAAAAGRIVLPSLGGQTQRGQDRITALSVKARQVDSGCCGRPGGRRRRGLRWLWAALWSDGAGRRRVLLTHCHVSLRWLRGVLTYVVALDHLDNSDCRR